MAKPDGSGRWIIGDSETVVISRKELADLRALVAGYRMRCEALERELAERCEAPSSPSPVDPTPVTKSAGAGLVGAVNEMLGTLRTTGAMASDEHSSEALGA